MNLIVYYKDIYKKQCKPKLEVKLIVKSLSQLMIDGGYAKAYDGGTKEGFAELDE